MHPIEKWRGFRVWKRHSLVLLVAGFIYALLGLSAILSPPRHDRDEALKIALQWMPLDGWGVVFIFCGSMAVLSSRWPPFSETWGYTVLTGLSSGWSAFYVMGILYGSPITNLNMVFTWGILGFLWWAISGLVNPDDNVAILLAENAALKSEIKALQTWKE